MQTTLEVSEALTIGVPAGAVGEDDLLLVATVKDTAEFIDEDDPNISLLGQIYAIYLARTDGELEVPLELSFKFDSAEVGNIENVAVYYYNERFGKWKYLGGEIDQETGVMTVKVSNLSKFALLEVTGAVEFQDIAYRWSEAHIKGLASLGVIDGVRIGDNYYYQPLRNITRLAFTKLVTEALVNVGEINPAQAENITVPFTDWEEVPQWGKYYARLAYANEIIQGMPIPEGVEFAADRAITRAEVAAIIARVVGQVEYEQSQFKDAAEIPAWAASYIDQLWYMDIVDGNTAELFMPNKNLSREEAAALIDKWITRTLR